MLFKSFKGFLRNTNVSYLLRQSRFFFKNWDLNADLCLLEVMTHFCVDFPKNESPIFILVRGIRISQDGQDVRSYYTFTSLECKTPY